MPFSGKGRAASSSCLASARRTRPHSAAADKEPSLVVRPRLTTANGQLDARSQRRADTSSPRILNSATSLAGTPVSLRAGLAAKEPFFSQSPSKTSGEHNRFSILTTVAAADEASTSARLRPSSSAGGRGHLNPSAAATEAAGEARGGAASAAFAGDAAGSTRDAGAARAAGAAGATRAAAASATGGPAWSLTTKLPRHR